MKKGWNKSIKKIFAKQKTLQQLLLWAVLPSQQVKSLRILLSNPPLIVLQKKITNGFGIARDGPPRKVSYKHQRGAVRWRLRIIPTANALLNSPTCEVLGNLSLGGGPLGSYSQHMKMRMVYRRPSTGSDAPATKKLRLKARSDAMSYLPILYI